MQSRRLSPSVGFVHRGQRRQIIERRRRSLKNSIAHLETLPFFGRVAVVLHGERRRSSREAPSFITGGAIVHCGRRCHSSEETSSFIMSCVHASTNELCLRPSVRNEQTLPLPIRPQQTLPSASLETATSEPATSERRWSL